MFIYSGTKLTLVIFYSNIVLQRTNCESPGIYHRPKRHARLYVSIRPGPSRRLLLTDRQSKQPDIMSRDLRPRSISDRNFK